MFLNKIIARNTFEAKIELEAAIAQRLVSEGRRELDAKRSMVRHVSHEIRYIPERCTGADVEVDRMKCE